MENYIKKLATYFVTMLDELHDDEPVNLDSGDAALILRVLPRPALRHLYTATQRTLEKHSSVDKNFSVAHSDNQCCGCGSVFFGPPGSGSGYISQRHGSFYHQAK